MGLEPATQSVFSGGTGVEFSGGTAVGFSGGAELIVYENRTHHTPIPPLDQQPP